MMMMNTLQLMLQLRLHTQTVIQHLIGLGLRRILWENEKPVESTKTLIGNGSRGDLRISTKESKSGQLNVSLHSILVYDLVPFEKRGDEWANPEADAENVGDVPF